MTTGDLARYDASMRELVQKVEERPHDADLAAEACYGLNIRSYHAQCMVLARKALAKSPGHAGIYHELIIASSLNTAHSLEDILDELESIADEKPQDSAIKRNLALVHYYLENDEEAENYLEPLIVDEHQADHRTLEVYAQLCYTRQDFDTCLRMCATAAERATAPARALRLKGLCHQELDEFQLAETCFRQALHLEPYFVWACHSLAVLSVERDDMEEAFRYFGKATYINPHDPGNLFLLAEAFIDRETFDLAAAELEKLLMLHPERRIEAEVHNALGYVHMKQELLDLAHEQFDLAIELEPELAVAHYNLGRLALVENDESLASKKFKYALELDPDHVETRVELGYFYLREKNWPEAEEQFQSALDVDHYDSAALQGLSKIRYQQHDYEEQLKFAKAAFEFDAENNEICNNLGIALECNDLLDQAEDVYQKILSRDPDHEAALNNLGYLYEKKMKEHPEEMEAYRQKAIDAWQQRLVLCQRSGHPIDSALKHLRGLDVSEQELQALTESI